MAWRPSTLQIALAASLLLHGGLLTLRLVDPNRFDRLFQDTPLEVILVNSRSSEAPTQATALAQANLAGGGELEAGRATSPLPPSKLMEVGEAVETQHTQIAQLKEQEQQLLTQVRRELALLPAPDPRRDKGSEDAREQTERRRALLQLLAEIEKRVNEESARPRKRYISPATREVVYALYYDHLRQRIEERGTRDFPEHKGRKLYGELTLNIHVDQGGRVIETDVVAPSGNAHLDRRAVAIVRAASPFGNFTPAMRQGAEVLVITSRFRFTREDGLETSVSGSNP
ncbi:protein TonB [Paucibacter oligotrophus]|uniref:Protein TonB n=1 Tax=Roseateles oligotrophus TaxID=1769250 RepID=A0A840LGY5_9BURK|nr:energy transducer TonB [Roseateles oligotrophus]MBB4845289.1 protein TonB [Roseateles oligotrophus]